MRKSEKKHWDVFWERAGEIEDVYSNEGRVAGRITEVLSPSGKRILEVGAGTGRDGIMLARMGASVVSLDYSLTGLNLIAKQVDREDSPALCCADAFALPFRDGTFDIVFHQGLLEHFRNRNDLISENTRVLKPGGYILVDVPQRYHYYTLIKRMMIPLGLWFAGWECEYSVSELEKLLEKHGFSVVSSYGEWFNPPIWYRMLRRALLPLGIRLSMYPGFFTLMGRIFKNLRNNILKQRWGMYTALVIGTIARKKQEVGAVEGSGG